MKKFSAILAITALLLDLSGARATTLADLINSNGAITTGRQGTIYSNFSFSVLPEGTGSFSGFYGPIDPAYVNVSLIDPSIGGLHFYVPSSVIGTAYAVAQSQIGLGGIPIPAFSFYSARISYDVTLPTSVDVFTGFRLVEFGDHSPGNDGEKTFNLMAMSVLPALAGVQPVVSQTQITDIPSAVAIVRSEWASTIHVEDDIGLAIEQCTAASGSNGTTCQLVVHDFFNTFYGLDLLEELRLQPGESGIAGIQGLPTSVTDVPETSTWAMMILGFAGIGFMAYRRMGMMTA